MMMNGLPAYAQWANWLMERLQVMEQRQQELEEENKRLQERIDSMEPVRCGDITYKIQELHIKELTGTLNIGLTSLAEEGQIQDMITQLKNEHMPNPDEAEEAPLMR